MPNEKPPLSDPTIAQFLFLASHGLRSPLTNIRWGLELLGKQKMGDLDQEQLDMIQDLHKSSKELATILKAMLLLERLARDKFEVDITNVRIADLFSDICGKQNELMGDNAVECILDIPDDMTLSSDETLMYEILHNLVYVYVHASDNPRKLTITGKQTEDGIILSFHSPILHLPQLNMHDATDPLKITEEHHVGGTPGLLMYLAINLSLAVRGSIEIENGQDEHDYTIHLACPNSSTEKK